MNKRLFFPLSINHYALLFLFIVATLFVGLGYFSLNKINQARFDLVQQNQSAAVQELRESIVLLHQTVFEVTQQLATWDELFQQLDSPAYYSYWRNHRLLHADILPNFIGSAEVFSAEGIALAELSDSQFPPQINTFNIQATLEIKQQKAYIVMYLPIQRLATTNNAIKGYLAVRFPFIASLDNSSQYHFINGIKLNPNLTDHNMALTDAYKTIQIDIKSNDEVDSMLEIVKSTIIQFATIVAILCFIFYLLMIYLLGKPIVGISVYIDQLRDQTLNHSDILLQTSSPVKELEKVKSSLNQYHLELQKAHSNLDQKNNKLWELAHHDSLTGMLNRRAFDNAWRNASQVLNKNRIGLGLILFDVNRFKAINDSYGHQVGDEVLKLISTYIQKALRQGEKLYRIGGDEFATVVIGNTAKEAMILSKRCVEAVNSQSFSSVGIKEKVTISCGTAHCNADNKESISNLQWQADIAVYQAKRPNGKNPVLFDNDMVDGTEAVFSSWMSDAVHAAVIDGSGIEMHYQAIIEQSTNQVKYYEALIRLHADDKWIPPSHIFPIITLRQLETELDRRVIGKVTEDLSNHLLPKNSGVSINLSAESITHKDLIQWMRPLERFTQDHSIVIEVTETSLITQLQAATESLNTLRKSGFKIALDDFGSGYSSLRYITSMPVDIIKFDIALIHGMLDERLGQLVHEMAQMLQKLDFDLVAEGIETEELKKLAKKAGFNLYQGYLFGKPSRENL